MSQLQKNVFRTYFKATILLVATFCLGCVIASGIARLLEKSKVPVASNQPDTANSCDVFVLKNTLREGGEVLPEDVMVVQQHNSKVPRGAVKTYQQIESRTIKAELPKGTLLLDEYFVAKTSTNNALGFIPPGYHSVPVLINEPVIVGTTKQSAVLRGDQVDIIIVQKDAETGVASGEFILLEKIPVLDTLWEDIGDSQKQEKKGTVSLLLSDSQRKNLQDECQEGTKIRLRICPPVETQIATPPQTQKPLELADSHNFYQTGHQPDLISQRLDSLAPQGQIEIVFHNNNGPLNSGSAMASQVLKPVNQAELQFPVFRGTPADVNSPVSQVSAIEKSKMIDPPVENRAAPPYSSFYDTSEYRANSNMQWRVIAPRSPLVYEARPESETKARGVYRDAGVYHSAK